jgi:hypothetical protein
MQSQSQWVVPGTNVQHPLAKTLVGAAKFSPNCAAGKDAQRVMFSSWQKSVYLLYQDENVSVPLSLWLVIATKGRQDPWGKLSTLVPHYSPGGATTCTTVHAAIFLSEWL